MNAFRKKGYYWIQRGSAKPVIAHWSPETFFSVPHWTHIGGTHTILKEDAIDSPVIRVISGPIKTPRLRNSK